MPEIEYCTWPGCDTSHVLAIPTDDSGYRFIGWHQATQAQRDAWWDSPPFDYNADPKYDA